MAYAVGHLSGGHFNPAVSIGAALAGRVGWATAAVYIVVQFIAAFLAAGVLAIIAVMLYDGAEWGDVLASVSNKWDTGPASSGAAFLGAFLIEVIGTFMFVFMILAVTDRRRAAEKIPAPVAIGLALTLCHLLLIGITGCSVNPARSLGPRHPELQLGRRHEVPVALPHRPGRRSRHRRLLAPDAVRS